MAGTPDNNPGGNYELQVSKEQIGGGPNGLLPEDPAYPEYLIKAALEGDKGARATLEKLGIGDRGLELRIPPLPPEGSEK